MKRFNNILCIMDPESSADTAIIQSAKIADDHQAEITFVSIIEEGGRNWRGARRNKSEYKKNLDEFRENKRAAMERRIEKLAPSLSAKVEVHSGISFIEIIKQVKARQHDLVVKCATETDWMDRLFKSEDMHLLRKCPCPVLMLKPGQNDSFRNILATVDMHDDESDPEEGRVQAQLNRQALDYSATFCMPELTELHIGSAWEAYAEDFYRYSAFSRAPEDEVDRYVEQVRTEYSDKLNAFVHEAGQALGKDAVQFLSPKVHLVKGKPSKEIPAMAEQYGIDLIVMGTVGRVGIPGLFIGNTAESILEQVKCSVLAIKPEGFKTPVE